MELALVWLALCLLVAAVARSRRRSGLAWFLVSVVFSPLVGVVMVLLIPPRAAAA